MSDEKSTSSARTRVWVAVVYPESLPKNWIDILDETSIPWCCSPLHDKDIDGDNKPKKAHYHILLHFSGKKSIEQVKTILAPLNCPPPQICHDINGNVRYMCHMDSPHKYQYSPSDIVGHNGFDCAQYLKATTSARYDYIGEMIDFIAEKHVSEFLDFLVYCRSCRRDTWYPLLCDNSAIIIKECIKSNRHRGAGAFINYDTGEVLLEDDRLSSDNVGGANNEQ